MLANARGPASSDVMATILVVDDDPDVNELARIVLARHGHRVLAAANGAQALAMLGAEPAIDLLLSDVVMPDMDGVALARHARALRPSLPILLVSGHVAGLAVPDATAFLRKPWRAERLVAEIDNLLRRAG
jgi:CheY-like chemotaxis protein